jgi:hypothetical protein
MISITNKLSMAARRTKEPVVMRVLSLRSRDVIINELPKRKRAAAVTAVTAAAVTAPRQTTAVVLNARTQLMVELQDVQKRIQFDLPVRRTVFASATVAGGNLLAAAAAAAAAVPAVASSPHFYRIFLASQVSLLQDATQLAFSFATAAPHRTADTEVSVAVLVCVAAAMWKARNRFLLQIQDAGRKFHSENAVRESVKQVRSQVLQQLPEAYQQRMSQFVGTNVRKIREYTSYSYEKLNSAMRRGSVSLEHQESIECMLKGMAKEVRLPVHRGTVYRGANLPEPAMNELRPGATYCDPAFLSTSRLRNQAFRGSVQFIIESKTGVDVASISAHRGEEEVLFRPATMFKIISVVRGEATLCVTMDELH